MRIACACVLLFACASNPSQPAATEVAGQIPSDAQRSPNPAPTPQPTTPAAPAPAIPAPAPINSADAGTQSAPGVHGAAGDARGAAAEDSPCQGDADCALTRVEAGACCPMLCSPRVVTAKRAQELRAKSADCGRRCPVPQCMPPRFGTVPACVEHRCVGKQAPVSD